MNLIKKFFSQTRRPEGFLGKLMLISMNSGHSKMAEWGMSYLPDFIPHQLLEMGCGAGANAKRLMNRYPGAHMTAIDISPLSVSKTEKYNRRMVEAGYCTVSLGNAAHLEFEDESFDLATAFETIYFWGSLEQSFAEIYRVLKNGGYFMICNESDGLDQTSLAFEKIIDGMKNHTAEEIEAALKSAGFAEVKTEHHPSKPWITVLAKKKDL
ncbi:MAG: class I SAM-dependent methyltransferase [Erysipelotrichaceae bacterium]|nr:class I SAM-dependent methyltransferase [Erysipelotrichaceae bacterium]